MRNGSLKDDTGCDDDIATHVLDVIQKLMLEQMPAVVPGSLLGKALNYLRGQWPKLVRYVENCNRSTSNNPCENAIRPFCHGRRGWLFADTVGGAYASANLYSPVELEKANRIDPYRYLPWLFQQLTSRRLSTTTTRCYPWKMPANLR